MKLVVAVTGGIGSGKSTAAKLFETLGAGLVDTDAIAQQLTLPGQQAIERIRKRFGDGYIDAQGALESIGTVFGTRVSDARAAAS